MSKRAGRQSSTSSVSTARPTGRFAVRPGTFNLAGELFTPDGARLVRTGSDVSVADARAAVRAGATVAFEACGCGGGGRECRPFWPDDAAVRAIARSSSPVISAKHSAPTWIDVWEGDGVHVAFFHGEVSWGSLFD